MNKFVKYCCLFIIAAGFTSVVYADDPTPAPATPDPSKEQVCPSGQTFDKELKACISKPADK